MVFKKCKELWFVKIKKISAKVSCFCAIIRMSPSGGLVIVCCNSIIP